MKSESSDPRFNYDSFETFSKILKQTHRSVPFLQFVGISKKDFQLIAADDTRIYKAARLSYCPQSRYLLVKMPSQNHELLSQQFAAVIFIQIHLMGLDTEVDSCGGSTTDFGDWIKEPDNCWMPSTSRLPTVVLETGASESTPHLSNSARAWIEANGSTVQICITIDLDAQNNFTIKVWERSPTPRHQHALRSVRPSGSAYVTQHIEIQRQHNSTARLSGWRYLPGGSVPTDRISLAFSAFTGRPAQPGTMERDFVLGSADLERLAQKLWARQGL